VPDEALGTYWTLLLGEELDTERHPNEAKRELARRLTDRFHGDGAGKAAEERFNEVHVRREIPEDIPVFALPANGEGAVHLPALIAGAFGTSASEARRLIKQGAVKLDGEPVAADVLDLPAEGLAGCVLQAGKRRFARLEPPA
jgi:tyrosyl-tRNA synthetase